MEEVDGIILQSLRQIACDIDDDVNALNLLDSDMTVKAAVTCLDLIQPGLGLPKALPHNMTAKYRVGQDIAQACRDIGYPGDVGYQTFLYPGESDLRKVLMFLIEKLPKEQEKFVHEPSGSELLLKKIKCKVKMEMSKPWLPNTYSSCPSTYAFLSQGNVHESPALNWNKLWSQDVPLNAVKARYFYPTIISVHSRCVLAEREPHWHQIKGKDCTQTAESVPKEGMFAIKKPVLPPKPTVHVKPEEDNAEEERLKKEEETLTAEVEQLLYDIQQLQMKKNQVIHDLATEEDLLTEKKMKNSLRARIIELLPDGENNILNLQQNVEAASQRIVLFAVQWEKLRLPLVEKYRKIIQANSSKKTETARRTETIKSMQEKRRELTTELKNKDNILRELEIQSGKIGREVRRSAYTRRIVEIIGNIKKQKTEIEKVLKDTREVQKEINNLSGQLDRSFTIADETIFRDAKRDEASRRAYKLLATLHSDCDQLAEMVQETGAIVREIRDLEDQIEKERKKNVSANLERITADLNQMKAESAQLAAQLNLKRGS